MEEVEEEEEIHVLDLGLSVGYKESETDPRLVRNRPTYFLYLRRVGTMIRAAKILQAIKHLKNMALTPRHHESPALRPWLWPWNVAE